MLNSSKKYANDGNAVSSHENLKNLFDTLKKHCPAFGYHLTKCHIITKEHLFESAQQIFAHDDLEIVDGCRLLSSVIGSENAAKEFVEISLKQQKQLLKKLAAHADVSPQNVYKSFTSSVRHKLRAIARTTPNVEDRLQEW